MGSGYTPHITRPRAALRHLKAAAMTTPPACLSVSYCRAAGRLEWREEARSLTFAACAQSVGVAAPLPTGQSVRVDYRYEGMSLSFVSRITGSTGRGLWTLRPPNTVACIPRRETPRRPLSDEEGVCLTMMTIQGLQAFSVIDLSSGGAAFRYDSGDVHLWAGRRLAAWMDLGTVKGVPVTIEVRHVSRRGGGLDHKIAGVRFVGLGPSLRRAIGHALPGGQLDH